VDQGGGPRDTAPVGHGRNPAKLRCRRRRLPCPAAKHDRRGHQPLAEALRRRGRAVRTRLPAAPVGGGGGGGGEPRLDHTESFLTGLTVATESRSDFASTGEWESAAGASRTTAGEDDGVDEENGFGVVGREEGGGGGEEDGALLRAWEEEGESWVGAGRSLAWAPGEEEGSERGGRRGASFDAAAPLPGGSGASRNQRLRGRHHGRRGGDGGGGGADETWKEGTRPAGCSRGSGRSLRCTRSGSERWVVFIVGCVVLVSLLFNEPVARTVLAYVCCLCSSGCMCLSRERLFSLPTTDGCDTLISLFVRSKIRRLAPVLAHGSLSGLFQCSHGPPRTSSSRKTHFLLSLTPLRRAAHHVGSGRVGSISVYLLPSLPGPRPPHLVDRIYLRLPALAARPCRTLSLGNA